MAHFSLFCCNNNLLELRVRKVFTHQEPGSVGPVTSFLVLGWFDSKQKNLDHRD